MTTPTPTPTRSTASGTTVVASRSQHKAPEETVHMNVLGRDGTDLDFISTTDRPADGGVAANANANATPGPPSSPRNKESSSGSPRARARSHSRKMAPADSNIPSSTAPAIINVPSTSTLTPAISNVSSASSGTSSKLKWWGKMVWGPKSHDEGGIDYQSLEAPLGDGRYTGLQQRKDSSSSSPTAASTPTVEDQLREDCSFFYQGMEDPSPRRMRGLRPLSSALALDRAPRVLSSRDNAMFHAKYHRLNQELLVEAHDDLLLDEENNPAETIDFQSGCSPHVVERQRSSLCYQQNGRLLMRVPRDQVRLIMDHDLEPGIISVEQWRREDKTQNAAEYPFEETFSADSSPPLRFVITVPDDLYRRVVAEMSYKLYPPYWGLFKCCNETDKADVEWAMAILFVILLLMFISTMKWPVS